MINIILPFISRFLRWSLSIKFSKQSFVKFASKCLIHIPSSSWLLVMSTNFDASRCVSLRVQRCSLNCSLFTTRNVLQDCALISSSNMATAVVHWTLFLCLLLKLIDSPSDVSPLEFLARNLKESFPLHEAFIRQTELPFIVSVSKTIRERLLISCPRI